MFFSFCECVCVHQGGSLALSSPKTVLWRVKAGGQWGPEFRACPCLVLQGCLQRTASLWASASAPAKGMSASCKSTAPQHCSCMWLGGFGGGQRKPVQVGSSRGIFTGKMSDGIRTTRKWLAKGREAAGTKNPVSPSPVSPGDHGLATCEGREGP